MLVHILKCIIIILYGSQSNLFEYKTNIKFVYFNIFEQTKYKSILCDNLK